MRVVLCNLNSAWEEFSRQVQFHALDLHPNVQSDADPKCSYRIIDAAGSCLPESHLVDAWPEHIDLSQLADLLRAEREMMRRTGQIDAIYGFVLPNPGQISDDDLHALRDLLANPQLSDRNTNILLLGAEQAAIDSVTSVPAVAEVMQGRKSVWKLVLDGKDALHRFYLLRLCVEAVAEIIRQSESPEYRHVYSLHSEYENGWVASFPESRERMNPDVPVYAQETDLCSACLPQVFDAGISSAEEPEQAASAEPRFQSRVERQVDLIEAAEMSETPSASGPGGESFGLTETKVPLFRDFKVIQSAQVKLWQATEKIDGILDPLYQTLHEKLGVCVEMASDKFELSEEQAGNPGFISLMQQAVDAVLKRQAELQRETQRLATELRPQLNRSVHDFYDVHQRTTALPYPRPLDSDTASTQFEKLQKVVRMQAGARWFVYLTGATFLGVIAPIFAMRWFNFSGFGPYLANPGEWLLDFTWLFVWLAVACGCGFWQAKKRKRAVEETLLGLEEWLQRHLKQNVEILDKVRRVTESAWKTRRLEDLADELNESMAKLEGRRDERERLKRVLTASRQHYDALGGDNLEIEGFDGAAELPGDSPELAKKLFERLEQAVAQVRFKEGTVRFVSKRNPNDRIELPGFENRFLLETSLDQLGPPGRDCLMLWTGPKVA